MFGKGISRIGSLLDSAVKYNIIDKKGAWYSYGEEKIGQGRDNARDYIEQHPDFANDLEQRLRKQIFPGREFPSAKASAASPASAEGGKKSPSAKEAPASTPPQPAAPAAAAATATAATATAAGTAKPAAVSPGAMSDAVHHQGPGRPRKQPPSDGQALSEEALF
jgi:recombination protein RecA